MLTIALRMGGRLHGFRVITAVLSAVDDSNGGVLRGGRKRSGLSKTCSGTEPREVHLWILK